MVSKEWIILFWLLYISEHVSIGLEDYVNYIYMTKDMDFQIFIMNSLKF